MSDFLKLTKVSKRFGKLEALRDVSFSIDRGEIVGLIGPNGAGKTTLFNVMTGFFHANSGQIVFKGENVTKSSPNRLACMGMVRTFQIPRPFKELSVYNNVAVATLFNPKSESISVPVKTFISGILERLELNRWKEELAATLGYVGLKRLELGRSQGASPELLLLDEPFSGLNPSEIKAESRLLRDLAERRITLIIVEHKLRELMKLVNRVIVLNFGIKIADGSPDEISRDEEVLKAYLGRKWSEKSS